MNVNSSQSGTGQKIVLTFLKDELQPVILELHSVARNASSFRTGFWGSFTQKNLRNIETAYVDAMNRFMAAYKKWCFPDELFKDAGSSYTPQALVDYMSMKPALQEHIHEGFRLLEYTDRVISGQRSAASNRVAIFLSIVAITVSIIVAICQA